MTRTVFLLCLLVAANACKQKREAVISPQRASATLKMPTWKYQQVFQGEAFKDYKVKFINAQKGYLFGTVYGDVWTTKDGAQSWQAIFSPAQNNFKLASLWDVFLLGDQHIYLSIQDTRGCPNDCNPKLCLLKSQDAGNSWQYVFADMGGVLTEIHFFDPKNGLGIRLSSLPDRTSTQDLVRTDDGGVSWKTVALVSNIGDYATHFQFISLKDGFFLANGGLYKTTDGGTTWQLIRLESADIATGFRQFKFSSAKTGYLSTFSGLYKTTNGGISWEKILSGYTKIMDFWQENEGMVIRQIESFPNDYPDANWEMLETNNAGQTWTRSEPVYNYSFSEATFLNKSLGLVRKGDLLEKFERQ